MASITPTFNQPRVLSETSARETGSGVIFPVVVFIR